MNTIESGNADTVRTPPHVGFRLFDTYSRYVHWFAFLGGVFLWLVTYSIAVRLVTGDAWTAISLAAGIATFFTSVYFAALFATAIGSPLGNLSAPVLIPVGLPGYVYRGLAPHWLADRSSVLPVVISVEGPHAGGGPATMAVYVSVITTTVLIGLGYLLRDDPRAWERRVMPDNFSVLASLRAVGSAGESSTWDKHLPALRPVFMWTLLFFGLAVIAAVLFTILSYWVPVRAEDTGGLLIVVSIVLYVVLSARPEA